MAIVGQKAQFFIGGACVFHHFNGMYSAMEMHILKKEIKFRAARRGMREMDILFNTFVAKALDDLSSLELLQLKALLEEGDGNVFAWVMEEQPTPAHHNTPLMEQLKKHMKTLHKHND